jgi:hypothetical protein
MKRATILCGLLALFATGAVIWQNRSFSNLREVEWRGAANEMGAVVEDAALKQEVVALRDATRELPKLRNEVGQLRVTRIELDRAREENARLLNAKQTGAPIPREAPPGFTSKERLTFAGFSTPENAVETFFWAMREGDVAAIFEAMSPENEDRVRFEQSTPEYREELAQKFRSEVQMMKHFNDFTIARREDTAADELTLFIRSSIAPNVLAIRAKRFGNEWKLSDLGPEGNGRTLPLPQVSPRRPPGR